MRARPVLRAARGGYPDPMRTVRRSARLGWGYRFAVAILRPLLLMFTRRDWRGTAMLHEDLGGIIIAPNHLSWFDPLAISHALWDNDRPPRFLTKASLFDVPVVGAVIRSAGQVPVYRQTAEAASAVRDALTALDQGECVVVYPEGTVTRDPGLWPMRGKTGAARMALMSGRPLIPVAQWGPQEVMRPYTKELRLLPRKTMRVWFGEPVDLDDLRGRPLDSDTLRTATERLTSATTQLLARIRDEQPPGVPMVFDGRGAS